MIVVTSTGAHVTVDRGSCILVLPDRKRPGMHHVVMAAPGRAHVRLFSHASAAECQSVRNRIITALQRGEARLRLHKVERAA